MLLSEHVNQTANSAIHLKGCFCVCVYLFHCRSLTCVCTACLYVMALVKAKLGQWCVCVCGLTSLLEKSKLKERYFDYQGRRHSFEKKARVSDDIRSRLK